MNLQNGRLLLMTERSQEKTEEQRWSVMGTLDKGHAFGQDCFKTM